MEAAQLSVQKFLKAITEEEEREVQQQGQVEELNDEEFYEDIQAPKFVDFTASDGPFRPDDCYWFCLRVGCDRKHEEELDPEEISKKFVLRVMAARSPNVRFRRALNGRNTSSMKCPLSAPAKSSSSRLPRLAMVSSMSHKMLDVKEKVGTHPKINSTSTPMVKGKQVASKYMTTPRNKRNLSHQTSFRSVQNPRPTKIAVPKSRLVAKALVFRSPKKTMPTETAVGLRTPLTKLCEGMKRLEITSQRKRVLGYSGKPAKGTKCNQNSTVVESSRKLQTIHSGKCGPSCHPDCKVKEAKSLRKVKTSNKQILTEQVEKASENKSGNETIDVKKASEIMESGGSEEDMTGGILNTSTNSEGDAINSLSNLDMNVDIKSRDGSALCHVIASEVIEHEVHLKTRVSEKEVLVSSEQLPFGKNSATVTSNASGEICSLTNLEGLDSTKSHSLLGEGIEDRGRIKVEDNARKSSKDEHGDDKENAQASDENRTFTCNNNHSKKKFLGTKKIHEKDKKLVQIVNKKVEDGIITATTGASDVKNRKPKLTNPKPFRLRTDERGILKESNMERRFYHPQKQDAAVSSLRGGNLLRRRGNDIKGNEKCSVQSNGISDNLEGGDKESLKDVENAEAKWSRATRLKTIREQACRTPQRRLISMQKIPNCTTSLQNNINNSKNKKSDHCIKKPESPMRQQLIRPQGKLMNSSKHRGPTTQVKSAGKPHESGFASVTKSTTSSASRPSALGRSLSTNPRGPVFHTASASCQGSTKKIA